MVSPSSVKARLPLYLFIAATGISLDTGCSLSPAIVIPITYSLRASTPERLACRGYGDRLIRLLFIVTQSVNTGIVALTGSDVCGSLCFSFAFSIRIRSLIPLDGRVFFGGHKSALVDLH